MTGIRNQIGRPLASRTTRESAGPDQEPAFGEADLSNCEREQIHLAGSIQPHGTLLVVQESSGLIRQASANARGFLHIDRDPVGVSLNRIEGNLPERLAPILTETLNEIPAAFQCSVGRPAVELDGLVHRLASGDLIVELEPASKPPPRDLAQSIEKGLQTIVTSTSVRALCDDACRLFHELTGYDRVMTYLFDDDGHGEVIAERRKPELESFLGNRYPASDIPQIARRLYERNRVRVLVDVDYTPVPIEPRVSPSTGQDLDMSYSYLRSMSPIHIQYLKNMGVSATLVLSIVVSGRLWGLIACHHYKPRHVSYLLRATSEILTETMATRIAALESFAQSQADLSVKRVEQRLVDAVSREGDWRASFIDSANSLLQPVNASGVALLYEGQVLTAGEVPGTADLREIGAWLDSRPQRTPLSTTSLGADEPIFAPLASSVSGLVAVRLSKSPSEYLMWFRPERVRTVTWGGNPFKPVEFGDDPKDLSPRRSFSKWHQLVEGTSEPWSVAELTAAREIGVMIADVLVQFRSVRLLIAQHQLSLAKRQAEHSDQPLIITDPDGAILLANDAVNHLIPPLQQESSSIHDLLSLVCEPAGAPERLEALLAQRTPWRGEIVVNLERDGFKLLLIRGDPVVSADDRALGFLFLFSDLTDRKAAEAARNQLQQGIVARHRLMVRRYDSPADLAYRDLIEKIVDNAQVAALEIGDGVDIDGMPQALEGVRTSATRSAELLEHLIWHATHRDRRPS